MPEAVLSSKFGSIVVSEPVLLSCAKSNNVPASHNQSTSLFVWLRPSVSQCIFILSDVARRRQTLYNVARLHLMSPVGLWRNSTPFFGAEPFCTTKIDDFRASFNIDVFDNNIVLFIKKEAFEEDYLELTKNRGN